jgi:hypothetical protein
MVVEGQGVGLDVGRLCDRADGGDLWKVVSRLNAILSF